MRSDTLPCTRLPRGRTGPRFLVAALLLAALAGCGGAAGRRSAGDLRSALPRELVARLPAGLEVCFDEASDDPPSYRLWLVRAPGREWLVPPAKIGPAHVHELPERILRGLFGAKAPDVDLGAPQQPRGRFTHWRFGETEIQAREVITEHGWFASLEAFEPTGAPGG